MLKRSLLSLCVATVTFSACGQVEEANEAQSNEMESSAQALVGPGGLTYDASYKIQLKQNSQCLSLSGSTLRTQACTSVSVVDGQLFDAVKSPANGFYFLCTKGSIAHKTNYADCDDLGCAIYPHAYVGQCIDQVWYNKSTVGVVELIVATSTDGTNYTANIGTYKQSNVSGEYSTLEYRYAGRRITRNSSGGIVHGAYSGNTDQTWKLLLSPVKSY